MKRRGYKFAIEWLSMNDDCDWLADEPSYASVCASLVADLFNKDTDTVTKDLRRFIARSSK